MGHWNDDRANEGRVRSQTPPCFPTSPLSGQGDGDLPDGHIARCKSLPELSPSAAWLGDDPKTFDPLIRCQGDSSSCLLQDSPHIRGGRRIFLFAFVPLLLSRVRSLFSRAPSPSHSQSHRVAGLSDEQRLRVKLEYHFMTPYQKYRRGRKPWKLAIQILKIVMVTTQISLFGADRFASVTFFQNTEKALSHLFIKGFDDTDDFSLYSRQDLVDALYFANQSYADVQNVAIGLFYYRNEAVEPPPMEYCVSSFARGTQNASAEAYSYDDKIETVCSDFTPALNLSDYIAVRHIFDRLISIKLKVEIHSIYLYGINFRHQPECFMFDVAIKFDNKNHDGRLTVSMDCVPNLMPTCPAVYTISQSSRVVKTFLVAFDVAVVVICCLSCALCVRSLVKSIRLSKVARKFFEVNWPEQRFTKWDTFEFMNKWFPVIVISDCLSVIGSIYKVFVDERDLEFYNICSILLGLGVILVWIGLLRFLAYVKAYNLLLITLRSAAPSLLRFMACALFIFVGFTLCGWVILGPYHVKFREFFVTAQCLFSLLNGDDMFPTFATMSQTDTTIWIFSKVYLYVFISLFIYVVLSTFISIVGDTYERMKDWGRLPQTKIQRFIEGRKDMTSRQHTAGGDCHRCARTMSSLPLSSDSVSSHINLLDTLSVSQLSVDSTSWE